MKSKLFATGGNGPRRNGDDDSQDTSDTPVDTSGKFEPKPAPADTDPAAPK